MEKGSATYPIAGQSNFCSLATAVNYN